MFKQTTYPRIDDAHNIMLVMINDIEQHATDPDYLIEKIKELIVFADRHFEDENFLMKQTKYKIYREHYNAHRYKILELFDMHRDVDATGWKDSYLEKIAELKEWFETHIQMYDDPLAKFLIEKGE